MNKAYDYNGTIVSTSKPVRELRTVKKTFLIDSADRDTTKYYTNGDVVYYLPRVYENVLSIRLKSASFPPLKVMTTNGDQLAREHYYSSGPNVPSGDFNTDVAVGGNRTEKYFVVEIDGLNKADETTVGASKSTFPDSFFARIPATPVAVIPQISAAAPTPVFAIDYNDHSYEENVACFSPALGKLDRLRIKTRLHSQQGNTGFIYWLTTDGAIDSNSIIGADYSMVFEITMLDNAFDNFSSFETRLSTRADTSTSVGTYGC